MIVRAIVSHGATTSEIRETTDVFDFIVVGAGMAGASVAAALASTARVALIEAERQPGFHATGRSAALFAPNYGSATFRALTRASAAFLRAPPDGFSPHPLLRARGALYLARADQLEDLQATLREMRAPDGRVEMLSVEAALAKVPRLRPGYLAAALLDVTVESVVAGVDPPTGEPAVEGGAACIEHPIPAPLPVQRHRPLAPETLRVLERPAIRLAISGCRRVHRVRLAQVGQLVPV